MTPLQLLQEVRLRFFKKRSAEYVPMIEHVPWWLMCLWIIGFVIVMSIFIALAVFFSPPTTTISSSKLTVSGNTIKTVIPSLNYLNQELRIKMTLFMKSDVSFGIDKSNFQYSVQLFGRNNPQELYYPVAQNVQSVRRLTCNTKECNAMDILYLSFLSYSEYELHVTLLENDPISFLLLDSHQIGFTYQTMNSLFSQWEIGFRYSLLVLCLPFVICILSYMCWRQEWKYWQLEQKNIAILLVLLLCYDNPIYFLHYYIPSAIFSFLNLFFICNYIIFLLYCGLVTAHSLLIKVEQRNRMFYLPKVILLCVLWICVMGLISFVRVKQSFDPTYDVYKDFEYSYIVIAMFTVFVIVIYLFALVYYMLRALDFIVKKRFPKSYVSKWLLVLMFTVFVVLGSIVDMCLYLFVLEVETGGQFLSFFALYNLFTLFMALLYIPSFNTYEELLVVQEQQGAHALLLEDSVYLEEH